MTIRTCCCIIGGVSCAAAAEYEIVHGPGHDDNTDSCARHLGDLMTDAPEHHVHRIDPPAGTVRDALMRAERKLSAYVGVCGGDKELTNAVLPLVRAAISIMDADPVAMSVVQSLEPISAEAAEEMKRFADELRKR